MADNTTLPGTGEIYASDDVGGLGVKWQRVKACFGVDGTANDVSALTPLPVQISPQTNGGLTTWTLTALGGVNSNSVKGSAGQLYGWQITNLSAAKRYVKLYNGSAAPTVGTDPVPIKIPLLATDKSEMYFDSGIPFSAGIGVGTTTGLADTDTGSVTAGDLVINFFFK